MKAARLSVRFLWSAFLYSIGFDMAEMLKTRSYYSFRIAIHRSKHNVTFASCAAIIMIIPSHRPPTVRQKRALTTGEA